MQLIKTNRLIVWLLLASIPLSCKKYLDKIPDTNLAAPSTLNDIRAILDNAQTINNATGNFGEASADDYFLLPKDYDALIDLRKTVYTWQPFDYIYSNDWSAAYTVVYYANLSLESLDQIGRTPANASEFDQLRGAALFHRASMFLSLAWTFAHTYDASTAATDLGIDLRLSSDYNIPSRRSSVEQTYRQLLEDAKVSLDLLPEQSTHVFRPNKAAACGLLARAYLSMRRYDSAFHYANRCLNVHPGLVDYNTIANTSSPFAPVAYSGEVIYASAINGLHAYYLLNPARAKVDSNLYKSYAPNDLRKKLFFQASGGYYQFKGSYNTTPRTLFSGIASDEMVLTRAECYARSGDLPKSLDDVNTLLKKRWSNQVPYPPVTVASAPEALSIILQERRKELLFRGLRWMDIKRLNKEGYQVVPTRMIKGQAVTLPVNSPYYALPLPDDIITLTGMPQNQ